MEVTMDYFSQANSAPLYILVGVVLLFVAISCVLFTRKSYLAGLKMGMDRNVLRTTITSSALFTVLPSISILLGVIALSGSLGVPSSWLRLSVVGNLSYEAIAAEAASQAMGVSLKDAASLTTGHLVTIVLVMTTGISWGIIATIFFGKSYSRKSTQLLNKSKKKEGKSFADWAMVAMFIGFCGTFIGSYVAEAVVFKHFLPLLTALVAGLVMKGCEYLVNEKQLAWMENFSLSLSMLIAMTAAVLLAL